MFNLLKNKLSSFVNSLSKKVGEKPAEQPKQEEKPLATAEQKKPEKPAEKPREEKKQELKLSLETRVRSILSPEVEIREKDVSNLLDELELSLLEADVAYDAAKSITSDMRSKLVGMHVNKNEIGRAANGLVRATLLGVMEKGKPDMVGLAKKKASLGEAFVILFLGPNGSGKTTTIAKVANLFKKNNLSCVIAAADTWRAASQEQSEVWAGRLGIKVIGGQYGSDPASIAWNALAHAKAKGIHVVLIDTAGRQETSRNLMKELEKMNRVVKPDLKVYVGEALTGNAIVEQVREFDKLIGVDGVILTKADVDEKGGAALSVFHSTGKPILYLGVGQELDDLQEFSPEFVVSSLLT
ncbi:signal recognition particle-docking protein FtsY [Candidatus Micrarchaeota archaeon]|nr:signal recognition particle-docking protein FtsY [Candidatus Micrarchaeota archaeon]